MDSKTITLACFSNYNIRFEVNRVEFEQLGIEMAKAELFSPIAREYLPRWFKPQRKETFAQVTECADSETFEVNLLERLIEKILPDLDADGKWEGDLFSVGFLDGFDRVSLAFRVSKRDFEGFKVRMGKKPSPGKVRNFLLSSAEDKEVYVSTSEKHWGLNGEILSLMSGEYSGGEGSGAKKFKF